MTEVERSRWTPVTRMMDDARPVALTAAASETWRQSPRSLLARLSFYKFASKMIGAPARVLDVGCGDGLGTWQLAVDCGRATGVDRDETAIAGAKANWTDDRITFDALRELAPGQAEYDGVIAYGARDWTGSKSPADLMRVLASHLKPHGVIVLGIEPHARACDHHKPAIDHWYSAIGDALHHTMIFSMFGEVISPGEHPAADRAVLLACRKRMSA